jgi:hypothetical protein
MTTKETTTEMIRISSDLVAYIKYIQKRYKEEYGVNINFTESSLILAKRAKEKVLFN